MGDVKVVLDTDVVVAAMRSPSGASAAMRSPSGASAAMRSPSGASAAILRAARQGKATLLLSVPLALEYEAVCSKAEHRLAAGLTGRQVAVYLDAVIAIATPVEPHFLWRPQLRDPNDEMVLEAAINGRADALVTFNIRDYGLAPSRFGVEALLPREAIARLS